jgi:hypothetical protein
MLMSTANATGARSGNDGGLIARRPGESSSIPPTFPPQSTAQEHLDNLISDNRAGSNLEQRPSDSVFAHQNGAPNGLVPEITFRSQTNPTTPAKKTLREDINHYYGTLGHGWTLFACSLCWFCVDLPF